MSSGFQTYAALVVVAVAAIWLLWRALAKRRRGGSSCGSDCGAVSPDVKKLQARLRAQTKTKS